MAVACSVAVALCPRKLDQSECMYFRNECQTSISWNPSSLSIRNFRCEPLHSAPILPMYCSNLVRLVSSSLQMTLRSGNEVAVEKEILKNFLGVPL